MYKTIGILAHVDAGKTTFSEQLLFHTKSIKRRGRVDHKDAFLDNHDIEKLRGITVFADQGMFEYNGSHYYVIDTPGHIDFSPEMERSIQVMDYAIIIISAVEGIEGHTETVWQLLRKHQVPTFFFINKMDRVGADISRVIEEIQLHLTPDICNISDSILNGEMNKELIEVIAERDEFLLEHYLESGYHKELWLTKMQKMIIDQQLFPFSSGSALQDMGIDSFLEKLDLLTQTKFSNEKAFSGKVYKIRHDHNGGKITFIKALSGTLRVRDVINYGSKENSITEKVTQLRLYNGSKYKIVDQISAGELFAVTGLSMTSIGDGVGSNQEKVIYDMVPTLKSKVSFEPSVNMREVLQKFKILESEDPSLNVIWEEIFQEIHIYVMGTIQLEVLEQVLWDRFQLRVKFDKPKILYKETITTEVLGFGHFEPLGHYAEVHLKLEPGQRNSGISFGNASHVDDLSVGNQNLIRNHLFEREHHGLLTGSPLTDINITLQTGRAHNKHTSGSDFREATYRALRQGLEKAKNILLEPIYQYKIKVDLDVMGRVLSDIQIAHGNFDAPITEGNKATLRGRVPVATFMNYSSQLASFTQGRGMISLVFAGYERCHNEKEIIKQMDYNKNADPKYTSSSIFCSKGQGFTVPWAEAEDKMHCI